VRSWVKVTHWSLVQLPLAITVATALAAVVVFVVKAMGYTDK